MTSGFDARSGPYFLDQTGLATVTGVELSPQFQLMSLQPFSSKQQPFSSMQPFSSKGKLMPLPTWSTTLGSSW